MGFLSLLSRILAILSAVVVVVFYIHGGNRIQKLTSSLEEVGSSNQRLETNLQEREQAYRQLKAQLDATVIELAEHKRDRRLQDGQVLVVRQEIEQLREKLGKTEADKLTFAEQNDTLRRENIELKGREFDPQNQPQRLRAQLDDQSMELRRLERELADARLVLKVLFGGGRSSTATASTSGVRVQRVVPEHQMLVLEAGSSHGMRENQRFTLRQGGIVVAKVEAARVTSDLTVVNVLSGSGNWKDLKVGTEVEILL